MNTIKLPKNSIDYFRNGTDINMVGVVWPQQPYELLATPRVTYKDEMSMHLNGHTIKIMHYGPAHTSGDSFIYFEESNVIHLGDVANLTGLPFIDAGNGGTLEGMIFSIREVMKIINEDTLIVPFVPVLDPMFAPKWTHVAFLARSFS